MASYLNRVNKRRRAGAFASLSSDLVFSSKTSAVLDGVGTVLEIFPDPRPRTVRAFYRYHSAPRAKSVKEAIWADWVAIGQDMWKAIEAHAPEKSTEEAGFKTLTAR